MGDDVAEAVAADVVVAGPRVGVDLRLPRNKKTTGDAGHPHAPSAAAAILDGDRDHRLTGGAAPVLAGPQAANVALIDLEGIGEQLGAREHHHTAQLVQPRPCVLVSKPASVGLTTAVQSESAEPISAAAEDR